jgi:hypothetical protein
MNRENTMARINMAEVVEALDGNFEKVLIAVVHDIAPESKVEPRAVMRSFRTRLERGFANWEQLPDRSVDAGY